MDSAESNAKYRLVVEGLREEHDQLLEEQLRRGERLKQLDLFIRSLQDRIRLGAQELRTKLNESQLDAALDEAQRERGALAEPYERGELLRDCDERAVHAGSGLIGEVAESMTVPISDSPFDQTVNLTDEIREVFAALSDGVALTALEVRDHLLNSLGLDERSAKRKQLLARVHSTLQRLHQQAELELAESKHGGRAYKRLPALRKRRDPHLKLINDYLTLQAGLEIDDQ